MSGAEGSPSNNPPKPLDQPTSTTPQPSTQHITPTQKHHTAHQNATTATRGATRHPSARAETTCFSLGRGAEWRGSSASSCRATCTAWASTSKAQSREQGVKRCSRERAWPPRPKVQSTWSRDGERRSRCWWVLGIKSGCRLRLLRTLIWPPNAKFALKTLNFCVLAVVEFC